MQHQAGRCVHVSASWHSSEPTRHRPGTDMSYAPPQLQAASKSTSARSSMSSTNAGQERTRNHRYPRNTSRFIFAPIQDSKSSNINPVQRFSKPCKANFGKVGGTHLPNMDMRISPALCDFWIGNCASSSTGPIDPKSIPLPGSDLDCNYKAYPGNGDICNATALIDTKNNGGVCPGNDDNRSLSFCGIELVGSGCPKSFQINLRDDCGDVALKNGRIPDDGFFYGDLIDTAKNNIAVGRCVYEQPATTEEKCATGAAKGEETSCKTFIRCYTGMYGSGDVC
ncbi:hypothetical protein AC579_8415 [Pseudocercospora musae]|uniref:Uncharacterized protein n=1 Tax=Pseudocercospora musae TaxID=113226 RepID=A0A139IIA3_9PEZI|nr:hypothetical protein AC579_8415 [Pseudocercospora musae]